jgi:hypothetical protein
LNRQAKKKPCRIFTGQGVTKFSVQFRQSGGRRWLSTVRKVYVPKEWSSSAGISDGEGSAEFRGY